MKRTYKHYWMNKEGKRVTIEDMDDKYLVNACKFAIRSKRNLDRGTKLYYLASPGPQGEMAQDAFDAELNQRLELSDEFSNAIRAFKLEISKRGLHNDFTP